MIQTLGSKLDQTWIIWIKVSGGHVSRVTRQFISLQCWIIWIKLFFARWINGLQALIQMIQHYGEIICPVTCVACPVMAHASDSYHVTSVRRPGSCVMRQTPIT